MAPDPTDAISALLRKERLARGWSLADLAQHSAVSKAMISKIERSEAIPAATGRGKLSGGCGRAVRWQVRAGRLVNWSGGRRSGRRLGNRP